MKSHELVLEPARFDWYQGTPECSEGDLLDLAWLHLGDEPPRRIRGKNGYARAHEIRAGGMTRATVFGGGGHPFPHILGTGPDADAVAALLRRWSDQNEEGVQFPHRVSRVDVAVDTDTPGAFGVLLDGLRDHALHGRVSARLMHDPDRAEEGATYYLGAKASEAMGRLYEKGKQLPDAGRPSWVRYELQLRPKRERKTWAAVAPPEDLLGAARWSHAFALEYLLEAGEAAPVRSERVSDFEGAMRALTRQYGNRLLELVELHEGDLGAVGAELAIRSMNGGLLLDAEAS